ncbi:DNA-binding response regulator, NarL/FixJ family, contains REC and HTH domains [Amycolatopsis xylanica]|uniref:DNA-binding response regulator, NarL/FixJ family, contains REC and HTH domains n=1 Tax=Amycolatopsis xylanica TaxID=589385 RepID=A0A1H2W8Y0_9PSEU|nr:response regulator transcription factor [Amycolatopsis xylanica]SDW76975.1 DNA-binding response regulator, NarL/FixJ family, contains REC and HTH domains [Amycolatopsis xylanica]
MTTVLVVDDQPLVRAGLTALLTASPDCEVVGEAGDGAEAVDRAREIRPEVILMDIRMPGVDGVTATRRILGAGLDPEPKILMLTTFDLDEYVYEGLQAGASGFLLKEAQPASLLAAIQAVAAGDKLFAPTVTRRLIDAFVDRYRPPVAPTAHEERLEPLTTREREVLSLVATGITNGDIARNLRITEGTVKTHLSRVMTKLALNSRAQAVVLAYETGLVGLPQP